MRLTQNDYRAALLQIYRAYRWNASGAAPLYSQAEAYLQAKRLVKPLPDDPVAINVREAYRYFKANRHLGLPPKGPRALWNYCYALQRAGDLLS